MKPSVTRSAATKRIQELEGCSASPLFARKGTRLVLTDQGSKLLAEAEALLQAMSTLTAPRNKKNRLARTLRIDVTELTALTRSLHAEVADTVRRCAARRA